MVTYEFLHQKLKEIIDNEVWIDISTAERIKLIIKKPIQILCEVNGEEKLISFSEGDTGNIVANIVDINNAKQQTSTLKFIKDLSEKTKENDELRNLLHDQVTESATLYGENLNLEKKLLLQIEENKRLRKELDGVLITRKMAIEGAMKHKLSESQIDQARDLKKEGKSLRYIAKVLGVSHQTIANHL